MRKRGTEALLTPDKINGREVRGEERDAACAVCVYMSVSARVCVRERE